MSNNVIKKDRNCMWKIWQLNKINLKKIILQINSHECALKIKKKKSYYLFHLNETILKIETALEIM